MISTYALTLGIPILQLDVQGDLYDSTTRYTDWS